MVNGRIRRRISNRYRFIMMIKEKEGFLSETGSPLMGKMKGTF
jgi:hypothetical protein